MSHLLMCHNMKKMILNLTGLVQILPRRIKTRARDNDYPEHYHSWPGAGGASQRNLRPVHEAGHQ